MLLGEITIDPDEAEYEVLVSKRFHYYRKLVQDLLALMNADYAKSIGYVPGKFQVAHQEEWSYPNLSIMRNRMHLDPDDPNLENYMGHVIWKGWHSEEDLRGATREYIKTQEQYASLMSHSLYYRIDFPCKLELDVEK